MVRRIARAATWRVKAQWGAQRDLWLGTFPALGDARLAAWLAPLPANALGRCEARIRCAAQATLAHRCDVLGSGEVEVRHGMICAGFERHRYAPAPAPRVDPDGRWLEDRINRSNLPDARRVWRMVDAAYVPIDWHLDIRSGHRWQERTWHKRIRFGHLPGVDVKVPWELARMQHLPALALAHALAVGGKAGLPDATICAREFRNQVLDFIATNPPRYGVNWACPMEVAIRMVNWIVARDLFLAHGARFDDDFEAELARSVRAHATHLYGHQEWHPVIRGNHYLSHMAGLIFAGASLPPSEQSDAWLQHGTRQLLHEIDYQFNADGSNFEASTSYHRLSSEIAVHALAVALRVPRARWKDTPELHDAVRSATLGRRLQGMADFLAALVRPDGGVPKIGDNDSGRLLRLLPAESGDDDLDPAGMAAQITALVPGAAESLETHVVRGLAKGFSYDAHGNAGDPGATVFRFFPDAGIYLHRGTGWYVCASCGPNGVAGHGGHAHNDKLSFELALDGVTFFTDSGSYVYTAAPELRNAFRATAAHSTLAVDGAEQNAWPPGPRGVFVLANRTRERVTIANAEIFEGSHEGYGTEHRRRLAFGGNGIVCDDWFADARASRIIFNLAPGTEIEQHAPEASSIMLRRAGVRLAMQLGGFRTVSVEEGLESPRYGVRHARPRLALHRAAAHSRIEFSRG